MPCISLPTALLIGAGTSAAGGIASGIMGQNAAKEAARTEAAAADKAIASTEKLYGQTKDSLNPFIQLGTEAIPGVKNLLGIGPEGANGMQAALEATPGYKFTRDQGLRAVQSRAAASGLAESGPSFKGAAEYATGLADSTYEKRLADYFGVLGSGANAASSLAGFTANASGQLNQLIGGKGQSLAGGIVGANNALTGGINSAFGGVSNAALALGMNNAGMFGGQKLPDINGPVSSKVYNPTYNPLFMNGG